jgi:hypothetical protein
MNVIVDAWKLSTGSYGDMECFGGLAIADSEAARMLEWIEKYCQGKKRKPDVKVETEQQGPKVKK